MIVIPDIHGRDFWRDAVEKATPGEEIIFLGDYLDPYPEEGFSFEDAFQGLRDIIELKKAAPEKVHLLLGNHDLHYIDPSFFGSRFETLHAGEIADLLRENWNLFQLAYSAAIGGKRFLFTHAGVMRGWFEQATGIRVPSGRFPDEALEGVVEFLNEGLGDGYHLLPLDLAAISKYRGGMDPFGGPLWGDIREFHEEEAEFGDVYQVVGHTQLEEAFIGDYFAGLDCRRAFRIRKDGAIVEI